MNNCKCGCGVKVKNNWVQGHNPKMLGVKMSKAVKEKISIAQRGEKCVLYGKKQSPELIKKRMIGLKRAYATGKRKPVMLCGKNNATWKGDEVGYFSLHDWVKRHKGSPEQCEFCFKDGLKGNSIQWANKSGKYLRDLNDWLRLCAKCHFRYDGYGKKAIETRRKNPIPNVNGTSGYKGVSWEKGVNKYRAYIQIGKKRINIGRYVNILDAYNARKIAELKYWL